MGEQGLAHKLKEGLDSVLCHSKETLKQALFNSQPPTTTSGIPRYPTMRRLSPSHSGENRLAGTDWRVPEKGQSSVRNPLREDGVRDANKRCDVKRSKHLVFRGTFIPNRSAILKSHCAPFSNNGSDNKILFHRVNLWIDST